MDYESHPDEWVFAGSRPAIINGAYYLQKTKGGKGKLISGVPGVNRAKVLVLGGGTVGEEGVRIDRQFHLQLAKTRQTNIGNPHISA